MLELRKGQHEDETTLIGTFNTEDECLVRLYENEGFLPPYIRTWGTSKLKNVDYGSHTWFYYIINLDTDEG